MYWEVINSRVDKISPAFLSKRFSFEKISFWEDFLMSRFSFEQIHLERVFFQQDFFWEDFLAEEFLLRRISFEKIFLPEEFLSRRISFRRFSFQMIFFRESFLSRRWSPTLVYRLPAPTSIDTSVYPPWSGLFFMRKIHMIKLDLIVPSVILDCRVVLQGR